MASHKAKMAGGSYSRFKSQKVSVVKEGSNSAPMEEDEPDNEVETSKVMQPGRRFGRKATISAVRTSKHYFGSRLIGKVEVGQAPVNYDVSAHAALDSRADTCCASATFAPIDLSGKICNVSPSVHLMILLRESLLGKRVRPLITQVLVP